MINLSKAGLYVIQFPSGRYGYVGRVPVTLGKEIPATEAAIYGGRAYRNDLGEVVELKFPSFETEQDAIKFAQSKGINPKT